MGSFAGNQSFYWEDSNWVGGIVPPLSSDQTCPTATPPHAHFSEAIVAVGVVQDQIGGHSLWHCGGRPIVRHGGGGGSGTHRGWRATPPLSKASRAVDTLHISAALFWNTMCFHWSTVRLTGCVIGPPPVSTALTLNVAVSWTTGSHNVTLGLPEVFFSPLFPCFFRKKAHHFF